MSKLTHWDYCQFLLASQVNYTQTYYADHSEEFSHDRINRMMQEIKLTPREVREMVREELVLSEKGYILFDDTVLDKNHSFAIELVRRQWSGNEKKVIKGIGVVTCVYVNPELKRFWMIDYRVYDPDRDGRSKIDHLLEMWRTVVHVERLPFQTVLMDSWYASMKVIKAIEKADKIYYCPVKKNRHISESREDPYLRVDALEWTETEVKCGKTVHLNRFPSGHQVKLFRIAMTTQRTDYIITNDMSQDSAQATKEESALRWKIEQFHREAKQVTGLESCQCRTQRAQRNHIACSMLVWVRLSHFAQELQTNVYQLKQGLLSDYMRQQLRKPTFSMRSA